MAVAFEAVTSAINDLGFFKRACIIASVVNEAQSMIFAAQVPAFTLRASRH